MVLLQLPSERTRPREKLAQSVWISQSRFSMRMGPTRRARRCSVAASRERRNLRSSYKNRENNHSFLSTECAQRPIAFLCKTCLNRLAINFTSRHGYLDRLNRPARSAAFSSTSCSATKRKDNKELRTRPSCQSVCIKAAKLRPEQRQRRVNQAKYDGKQTSDYSGSHPPYPRITLNENEAIRNPTEAKPAQAE